MPYGTELRCTIHFGTDGTTCCLRRDGPDESLGDLSFGLQSDKLRNLPQLFVRAVCASSWQQGEQWHSVLSVAADIPGTSLEHAIVPDTKS